MTKVSDCDPDNTEDVGFISVAINETKADELRSDQKC